MEGLYTFSENEKRVIKKIARIFQENEIQFQITGGCAAVFYGSQRPIYDVDFEVFEKDISKIRDLLRAYITEDYHLFEDENWSLWMLTLEVDGVLVDISQVEKCYFGSVKGEKELFGTDMKNTTLVYFEGLSLPIANKQELIDYKKILARPTDLIDVQRISQN